MMMIISYMFSTPKDIYIFNRYSIFYVIEVTGIWMLFKNFNKLNFNIKFISNPDGIFRKFCSTLAKYSYGMYLTHVAFLSISWYFLPRKPFMLSVTILLLVSIFIPLGILAVLNRIPYVNQVIGAK